MAMKTNQKTQPTKKQATTIREATKKNKTNKKLFRKANLGRGFVVFLRDGLDFGILQKGRIIGFGPRSVRGSQWTVGRDGDSARLTKIHQFRVVEIGMDLDLGREVREIRNESRRKARQKRRQKWKEKAREGNGEEKEEGEEKKEEEEKDSSVEKNRSEITRGWEIITVW